MENVEKVTVLTPEIVVARDAVNASLEAGREAVKNFFGGDNVIDGAAVTEQSPAHALIVAAKNEVIAAGALKITSVEHYAAAAEDLKRIKGLGKDLEEKRVNMTKPIDAAKGSIQALFKPAKDFLDNAETKIKQAMLVFSDEQDRLRLEAQRKAEEEARRERARLEAEAAERAAKARQAEEDLRRQAEEARATGDEATAARLDVRATAAADIAESKVTGLEERAASIVAAPVAHATPKVSGISTRTTYAAEVTDLKALCAAVAAGTVPINVIQADMKVLNQMAKALKENLNYPGVRVVADKSIGSRAA